MKDFDKLDMDKLLTKVTKGKTRKTSDILKEASVRYCNMSKKTRKLRF